MTRINTTSSSNCSVVAEKPSCSLQGVSVAEI